MHNSLLSFGKTMVMKKLLILLIALGFILPTVSAQKLKPDSTLKNTVRLNVTPIFITTRLASFSMGYERVITPHQTISTNLGYLELPTLITTSEGDPVKWISNLRNSGFLASLDYRFYIKRNRYTAPDGLYWGPYMVFYYLDHKSRAELFDNDIAQGAVSIQTYASILNAGLQLGYQFVLGKRWTVDMILFGPGFGYYDLTLLIDADAQLKVDGEDYQAVYDKLVSVFPAIQQLFEEQKFNTRGTQSFSGLGYRFVVQVGFRF